MTVPQREEDIPITPFPERLPDESTFWHKRFLDWLQHPKRSILAVYLAAMTPEQIRVRKRPITNSPGSWRNASAEFKWHERAEVYDEAEAARMELVWSARREANRQAEYETARLLRAKAQSMLALPIAQQRTSDNQTIINPAKPDVFRTAAYMVEVASKQSRLASGDETDRAEIAHTGQGVVIYIPDNQRGDTLTPPTTMQPPPLQPINEGGGDGEAETPPEP